MSSIEAIISDLEFGRSELLKAIDGLSKREMTTIPIYGDWTIKDVLAHIVGWDERVIRTLPLMLENRADDIPDVEVEAYNRQSVAAWRDRPLAEVIARIHETHARIIHLLSQIDHMEIDRRRQRKNRTITIRSYVIDVMMEHERGHAAEIMQWRKSLARQVNLDNLRAALLERCAAWWKAVEGLDEPSVLDPTAAGRWSIKDVVCHLAAWEELILQAGRHIYDPSLPDAPPPGDTIEAINQVLHERHRQKSWAEACQYLRRVQGELQDFVRTLRPGDCLLRGPYPWPNDQGTLAELLTHAAEHYDQHLPDLTRWRERTAAARPAASPWIRWVADQEATGLLAKEYQAAIKRAGRVWNIVRVMSLNPPALQASMRLYAALLHRHTPRLGRAEREMIAVVVSQANRCFY
ncbi:MAG: ClbS/DfsB family four-helix bundle protein [Chloroflexi bacterium]|nr:MAG: ClbS/DfsB family four-helix bundle protein [Chloroflexota bacterium]